MKVKMLVTTQWFGRKIAGEVYEVDDKVALRWYKNKIATVPKSEVAKLEELEEELDEKEENEDETPDDDKEELNDDIRNSGTSSNIYGNTSGGIAKPNRKTNKKSK